MKFPIAEIFGPTIQGEGAVVGQRSHFVRFAYCDGLPSGHCTWCDSMHAVDPKNKASWRRLTAEQIVQEVRALPGPCRMVTLSGGNPCIYDLEDVVYWLQDSHTIWVETQGSIWRPWLQSCNVTVSPKPPSAGVCDEGKLENFLYWRFQDDSEIVDSDGYYRATHMKIPVDPGYKDGEDLIFAQRLINAYRGETTLMSFSVSTVTYPDDSRDDVIARWKAVIEWALEANIPDVRILPQLHVILWGHAVGV